MSAPALPAYIDSTMIACFRSCPKKFENEFLHGFRVPGTSIDLHAGGCFASAIEETYIQVHLHKKPLKEALDIARLRFFNEWGDYQIPDWKKTSKTADRMWTAIEGGTDPDDRGYFQEYPPLTDHVQPYFGIDGKPTFEYTFAIPLEPITQTESDGGFPSHPSGSPFLYSGKLDMMGTYLGKPIWRDEKTSKNNPQSNKLWSEQWDLRSQFIGYTWALQQMGMDCDGGVVRGIGILKEKIGHAEAIKFYSKTVIARWYEQLRRDLWRIVRCHQDGYFDYNFADGCTSYGSCVFMEPCQSADPSSWFNRFEVRHWNPLEKRK